MVVLHMRGNIIAAMGPCGIRVKTNDMLLQNPPEILFEKSQVGADLTRCLSEQ